MNLKDFCINENETIIQAIEAIDKNHQRSIFLVNDDEKIVGVISQGDIIREMIEGVSVYSHCSKISNSSFKYLTSRDIKKAYSIFKSINLSVIPVVDKSFHLTSVITQHDIYDYIEGKE